MGIYALRQALRERLESRGETEGRLNESDREWIADMVDKKDTPEGNPDVRAIPYVVGILTRDENDEELAREVFYEYFAAMAYLRQQRDNPEVYGIWMCLDGGGYFAEWHREPYFDDEYAEYMEESFDEIEDWIEREKVEYVRVEVWPNEAELERDEMDLLLEATYDEDDDDAVGFLEQLEKEGKLEDFSEGRLTEEDISTDEADECEKCEDKPLPDWGIDNEGCMPVSKQRDKYKSEVPCLDLQYSFSAQTDDIWEDAFHTMIHCDIFQDENMNYYGNCLNRPGERRKVGEVELEILNWKRAVKYIGSTWSTAGLCRDSVNSIVELFVDKKGNIKKEFVKEFELCESKNILYVHDMQLIGECRGKGWGKYVLKSILETFDGMFGIMVIDANADHYAYMEGEYQEPGVKYPLKLDERTLWDEQKEATIKLVRYYISLGFKTFGTPLKSPYGFVDSNMWLNSGRENKEMEEVDIHVYWDY